METVAAADLPENGSCWRGMFRNPVIVTGYPIPRRSEAEAGLEIPLDMVATLTNCRRLVKFNHTVFLKGFAAVLVAVRVVGDLVLWHLRYNPNGDYIACTDHGLAHQPPLQGSAEALTIDTMEKSRHIVGWTDKVMNFAGLSSGSPIQVDQG